MQWEKRWGNFNWQNNMLVGICKALTTFIDATNAFSCYIYSYKNKPSSTYFTNTYMSLIIFMKNSLSTIQNNNLKGNINCY